MAPDQPRPNDPKLAFGVSLPSKALPRFSGLELLAAVTEKLKGTGVTSVLEPDLTRFDESPDDARVWNRPKAPPRVGLTVNGVTMMIEGHDRPAFNSSGLAQLDFQLWPEGRERIVPARTHVEIIEVDAKGGTDLDHNYDRGAAVMVVAAALSGLTDALALIWHTSRRVVPIGQLAPLVAALAQGKAPVSLWLGCVARPAGARGVATRGLYHFLGAEIEVASWDLPGDAAFEVALELAAEIFHAGEPPEHGEHIGNYAGADFSAQHRPGSHVGTMPALVLTQTSEPKDPPGDVNIAAGAA